MTEWVPAMHAAVTSPEQILDIMSRGFEQRKTGCHDINAHSSRYSHPATMPQRGLCI